MAEVDSNILDIVRQIASKTRLTRLAKTIAPGRYWSWKKYYRFRDKVRDGYVLVDEDELLREYRNAVRWMVENIGPEKMGDYLEFGVFYGSSLTCMHRVLGEFGLNRTRLFGFDSFDGLPESSHPDDQHWHPGQFKSSYKFAQEFLTEQGVDWTRVVLAKGWFSETLTKDFIQTHNVTKASLVMIDCDMYQSAKEALDFCAPLIHDEAILFFDDWNSGKLADKNQGEKRAFDEFLHENPRFVAEEFGSYNYKGKENAKIFRVSVKH